jgi:hypothetical protein
LLALAPLKIYSGELAQTLALSPAKAIGWRVMRKVIELVTLVHGALAVTFSVNVTAPAVISAALGV